MFEEAVSDDQVDPCDPDMDEDTVSVVSLDGERLRVLGSAGEVLARVELDLAYSSEKMLNLDILLMHVATRENDYETLTMEKEEICDDSIEEGLEFDLLSGILDSEVRELENLMDSLLPQIEDVREKISSCEHLREAFSVMERKLHDSEDSLEQAQNQVADIRMQCDQFQRTLLAFYAQENWTVTKDADLSENDQFDNKNTKIKMQTVEQQRHILRMLEKSLARELDLERKLSDSRYNEEELTLKLHSAEQEIFSMDETHEDLLWRLFEAENASEILMGISKEIMGRFQNVQVNLIGSIQGEEGTGSKLQDLMKLTEMKGGGLQMLESNSAKPDNLDVAQHSISTLEVSKMTNIIDDLKASISKAESRAETAESKYTLLEETNLVLTEELSLLKSSDNGTEKVKMLEKELSDLDLQLQHAKAAADASQEQQSMLYSAIKDMENLINDLKSKVSQAESRANKSENKCAFLTGKILELNEELAFLRKRTECLETSLHQADEERTSTAKEINKRAKVITDLVMQLALERERLHKQMSTLTKENKILAAKIWKGFDGNSDEKEILDKVDSNTGFGTEESEEAVAESSATRFQVNKTGRNAPPREAEVEPTVSAEDAAAGESNPESVRKFTARRRISNYFLMPIVVLLVSVITVYLLHIQKGTDFDGY